MFSKNSLFLIKIVGVIPEILLILCCLREIVLLFVSTNKNFFYWFYLFNYKIILRLYSLFFLCYRQVYHMLDFRWPLFFLCVVSQFSGPIALLVWGFYCSFEVVFPIYVTFGAIFLVVHLFLAFEVVVAYFIYFLLGLVFKEHRDFILLQLYYIIAAVYVIFFTASFFSRVYFDLINFGLFDGFAEFLPVAHCMRPDEHERFFVSLENLVGVFGEFLFHKGANPVEVDLCLAPLQELVVNAAVQELILMRNGSFTFASEATFRDILISHLSGVAHACKDYASKLYFIPTPEQADWVTEFHQRKIIYNVVCYKAYLDFFFQNPSLFPDIDPKFCKKTDCTWFIKTSYADVVNACVKKNHYSILSLHGRPFTVQPLIDAVVPQNMRVTEDLLDSIYPHVSVDSRYKLLNNCVSYNKINFYQPPTVIVSSSGMVGSVNVSPAEAGVIKVGTPEYEERLVKSWDNIAASGNNISYWDRFQKWLYINPVSDKEYINSLRTTTDPRVQKILLAGLHTPPVNHSTNFLSYLYPQKYHFVGDVLLPKGKPVKVDFLYMGEEYGIPRKGSLATRVIKLYDVIDSELVIAKAQNVSHLASSKRL